MARSLTFTSDKFTYDKSGDIFIGEASELKFFDGRSFYIKSARTGVCKLFLVTGREFSKDADREFVAWHGFCPGEGHRVTIFND